MRGTMTDVGAQRWVKTVVYLDWWNTQAKLLFQFYRFNLKVLFPTRLCHKTHDTHTHTHTSPITASLLDVVYTAVNQCCTAALMCIVITIEADVNTGVAYNINNYYTIMYLLLYVAGHGESTYLH